MLKRKKIFTALTALVITSSLMMIGNTASAATSSSAKTTNVVSGIDSVDYNLSRSISALATKAATKATTKITNKSVRVIWLRPKDVPYDQKVVDGITRVMVEAQKYYKKELGKTFTLNSPVVEVCVGDHNRQWYETDSTLTTDPYFRTGFNMTAELRRKYGLIDPDDPRYVVVGEISAEGDGAGGFGGNGWVGLTKHDVDGAAGINGDMNRWYGGMVHELGHAFGQPDSTYTDGTPMSASFYSYPNCHFTTAQKNAILNDGIHGSFFK